MITSDQEYIDLVKTKGLGFANNEAASSWYDVNPDVVANMTSQYSGSSGAIESPIVDTSQTGNKSAYDKFATEDYKGLAEGENRVTGGYGLDTLPAWLGGKNNTGIVNAASGVVNAGATIGKTYLAYQQFQQNKIDNEKKFALMQEANMMKRTQMNNMVAEARRRSAAGMGNSNNQTATLASAARNPYLNAQYSRVG